MPRCLMRCETRSTPSQPLTSNRTRSTEDCVVSLIGLIPLLQCKWNKIWSLFWMIMRKRARSGDQVRRFCASSSTTFWIMPSWSKANLEQTLPPSILRKQSKIFVRSKWCKLSSSKSIFAVLLKALEIASKSALTGKESNKSSLTCSRMPLSSLEVVEK